MKKTLLLFCILFQTIITYSQETDEIIDDSSYFLAKVVSEYSSLKESSEITPDVIEMLSKGQTVCAFEIVNHPQLNDYKLVGVYKDTLMGYVPLKDLYMPENKLEYLLSKKGDLSIRKEKAKNNALLLLLDKIEKLTNKYESYDKIGLVITKKDYAYEEYSDAFGLSLDFYNGYNKQIKYIDITVRPYNRVGDLTKDDFGRDVKRVQVIGPLNKKSISEVTFKNMFWDERDIINRIVITYMKVTFMDNTVKEIKNINQHLGEGVYNGK